MEKVQGPEGATTAWVLLCLEQVLRAVGQGNRAVSLATNGQHKEHQQQSSPACAAATASPPLSHFRLRPESLASLVVLGVAACAPVIGRAMRSDASSRTAAGRLIDRSMWRPNHRRRPMPRCKKLEEAQATRCFRCY